MAHRSSTPAPAPNIFDEVLESLEAERIRQANKSESKLETIIECSLKEFEDSLKEKTEEAERETVERNERMRKFEQDTEEKEGEIENIREKLESSRSSFGEFGAMNRELERKLEEQNRMNVEKLRAMREEKARKEKEGAEEFEQIRCKFRQESLASFRVKIECDKKIEECKKWLRFLRERLFTVIIAYSEFQNENADLDTTDDFLLSFFRSEVTRFATTVEDAQNMLLVAFNKLNQLSMGFEDKIYPRMIMKSCSEQGQVCNSIGYKLVEVLKSPNPKLHLQNLEKEVAELKPHNIPTIETLKISASSANEEDYRVIETVPAPDWIHDLK